MSSNRHQRITNKLKDRFADLVLLDLVDESSQHSVPQGSESHFKLLLVSDEFVGQTRIARQRQVLNLLSEELKQGLHALSMRLLTKEEWAEQKGEFQSPPCASKSKS